MIHIISFLYIGLVIFMFMQIRSWLRFNKVQIFIRKQYDLDLLQLHAANDPEFSPVLYEKPKDFDVNGKSLAESIQEVEQYYNKIILPSVRIFLSERKLASHISRGEHMQIILHGIKQMDQARAKVLRKFPPEEVLDWKHQQNSYPVKDNS